MTLQQRFYVGVPCFQIATLGGDPCHRIRCASRLNAVPALAWFATRTQLFAYSISMLAASEVFRALLFPPERTDCCLPTADFAISLVLS